MSMLIENCPRCGSAKVTFDVTCAHQIATYYGWQRVFEAFSTCRGCNRSTIFFLKQKDIQSQDLLNVKALSALPNLNQIFKIEGYMSLKDTAAEKAPDHLPAQIEVAFNEGSVCMAVRCFNAAGTMYRLCLDLATREQMPIDNVDGLNSKIRFSLGLRLKWLFETKRLPVGLQDLSNCVKEDGNDGAHEGTLTEHDAHDLQDFTIALLERLYTEPKRIESAKARRDARRADAA